MATPDGDVEWVPVTEHVSTEFRPPLPLELAETISLSSSLQGVIVEAIQLMTEMLEAVDNHRADGVVSHHLLRLLMQVESLKAAADAEIGMYITGAVVTVNEMPAEIKATFRTRALKWLQDRQSGVR